MSGREAVLAIHANLWLAGRRDVVSRDFHEHHRAFTFVSAIEFEPGTGVLEWLESLRDRGAERIRLHSESSETGLLVTGTAPTELWVCGLEKDDRPEPTRSPADGMRSRVWRLRFTRRDMPDAVPTDTDRVAAAKRLGEALRAIESFAAGLTPSDSPGAAKPFAKTRQTLASAIDTLQGRADDTLDIVRESVPSGALDLDTLRMVAAAGRASTVGTGSGRNAWTETGTLNWDDAQTFDGYCQRLFEAAQAVSRAAVNGAAAWR